MRVLKLRGTSIADNTFEVPVRTKGLWRALGEAFKDQSWFSELCATRPKTCPVHGDSTNARVLEPGLKPGKDSAGCRVPIRHQILVCINECDHVTLIVR